MGLFDQILGAVAGSSGQQNNQLGTIMNVVSQLSSNQGIDPSVMNSLLTTVATQVKKSLQNNPDPQQVVADLQGTEHNPAAVEALFGDQQTQVAQTAAQQTGLNIATIQAMLPTLIPIVLSMLNSTQGQSGQGNPLLSAFLDTDRDGDTDINDLLNFAGRFAK